MKKIYGANYLLLLVLIICITGAYGQDRQKRPVNVNNAMKVDPNEYLRKIKLPAGFKISKVNAINREPKFIFLIALETF